MLWKRQNWTCYFISPIFWEIRIESSEVNLKVPAVFDCAGGEGSDAIEMLVHTYRSWLRYISRETVICPYPPIHNFTRDKTWQMLNGPTFKHVLYLQRYKGKQFFADTTFWQKACLWTSCLVMREFQFDEFCGLWQIAVSRAVSLKMKTFTSRAAGI